MASGTSTYQERGKNDSEWKLKKIRNFWFLDVGGKLKRLNILDNANDVQLEDNVIFADEIQYQLMVKSDGEIVVTEIEEVLKRSIATANKSMVRWMLDKGKFRDRSDKDSSFDEKADDKSSLAPVHMKDAKHASESDEDLLPDSETDCNLEMGQEECFDEPRADSGHASKINDDSNPESNPDETLDKGHEMYIRKKGKFLGVFGRIKTAFKWKPLRRQKDPYYESSATYLTPCTDSKDKDHTSDYDVLPYSRKSDDKIEKAAAKGLLCKLESSPPKKAPIVYPRSLVVGRKSLDVKEPLKCGKYENLFSGTFSNTLDVTVVTIAKGQMKKNDFIAQTRLLYNFRNAEAKIVRVIAVSVDPEPFMIVIGETIHGTLTEYLQNDRGKTLKFEALATIAAEIADAMDFLEKNKVVHRDLRADRVFVCGLNAVKVAHPKLTAMMSRSAAIRELEEKDKWKWTAPEAVNDDTMFSTKSDVWSYGILLYELITFGQEPYKDGDLSLEKPTDGPVDCSFVYYDTMLKCCDSKPKSRPTFDFLKFLFLDFDAAVEKYSFSKR